MVNAIIFLSYIMLAILVCAEYRKKSPLIIFYCSVMMVFYLPVTMQYAMNPKYPDYVYLVANVFASGYLIIFCLSIGFIRSYLGTSRVWDNITYFHIQRSTSSIVDRSIREQRIPIALACLSIAGFVIGLKLYSLDAIINLDWWELVQSDSPLPLVSTYIAYASAGILPLAIALRKIGVQQAFPFILSLLWILFAVFVLQTRSYLLIFLMPAMIYLLTSDGKKTKSVSIIILVFSVILFIVARAVRHSGGLEAFLAGDMWFLFEGATDGAEQDLFDAFLHFISINNYFPGFEENATLRRILFFWYPPIKPPEFSYTMHDAYFGYMKNDGLSMHPTVFGDAYANAGLWGMAIYSILLALIVGAIENLVKTTKSPVVMFTAYGTLSVTLLVFARGAVYNAFMFTVIPISLVAIVCKLFDVVMPIQRSLATR